MSVYKVRVMVLALVTADDPYDARQAATEMTADAGLDVLHIEDPEKVETKPTYRDQGDIYP